MTTVRSFAIAAALLAAGTSLAIAQNGPQTSAPSPATKDQCAGIRQGLVECHKMHMAAANSNGTSENNGTSGNNAASAGKPMHGSDTVILSAAQRRAVWNALSKAANQNAKGHNATVGTFVPKTVTIKPIPGKVTAENPSLKPYDFAMVDHKLVIVDPTNKVIADVVTK
jgi:hypothetical protein